MEIQMNSNSNKPTLIVSIQKSEKVSSISVVLPCRHMTTTRIYLPLDASTSPHTARRHKDFTPYVSNLSIQFFCHPRSRSTFLRIPIQPQRSSRYHFVKTTHLGSPTIEGIQPSLSAPEYKNNERRVFWFD